MRACSVRSGFNGPGVDRFPLAQNRGLRQPTRVWRFRQKIKFGANDVSPLYPIRYYAGRIAARLGF